MKNGKLRPSNSVPSRVTRLWQSSGSFSKLTSRLVEEACCRLCDRAVARRCLAAFAPQREPEKWVFVVGCYNSGTTLLQKMLSAHPAISGMPREGVRFTDALSNLELNDHHMFWDETWRSHVHPPAESSGQIAAQVKRDWSIFWGRKSEIFLEKSIANTARIAWLNEHFPNAHFIALHRNGYCIAEGLHRRSRPPAWLVEKTGGQRYPLSMAAEQWVTANEAMLDGLRQVDNKMTLSFEDFVADPLGQTNQILRFIGVSESARLTTDGAVSIGTETFTVRNTNIASLERLGSRKSEIAEIIEPMMQKLSAPSSVKSTARQKDCV